MLFELIYCSEAKSGLMQEDHKAILEIARAFNKENDITGCLLYHKGRFLQLLEGDFEVLNQLYARIRQDKRHENVITLHMKEIEDRIFDKWSMAYKIIDDVDFLKTHAGVQSFSELPTEENESKESKVIFNVLGTQIMNA